MACETMAPRSAPPVLTQDTNKLGRSKTTDFYHKSRKSSIRDMMAKVTGSRVIEMTFYDQVHAHSANSGLSQGHPSKKVDDGERNKTSSGNSDCGRKHQPQKRYPVLGPTRQDTELFTVSRSRTRGPSGHEQSGDRKRVQPSPTPGWQDQPPSRCASRSTLHPNTGNDVTRIDIYPDSNGDPATRWSEQRPTAAAGLSSKPPRSSFAKSADHESRKSSGQRKHSRSAASSATNAATSASDLKGRGRHAGSEKYTQGDTGGHEEDDDDVVRDDDGDVGSGVYCVIRSGVAAPRARAGGRQAAGVLTKHQFRQVCSRPHQAVVFTADTASLLLQSGPPLLIRPAADVYFHRSAARSAIQRVTDANYFTDLHGVPRSKSGVEGVSRRKQDLYRGRLALSRSGSLQNADLSHPHLEASQRKFADSPVKAIQRASSEDTLCRTNSDEVKKKRVDPTQAAYISRESSAPSVGGRHHKHSTQQARGEAISTPSALNMASRPHVKQGSQHKSRLKQQPEGQAANQKTLSPSKHGFHPRSHSPTFKRLIAASERLQETQSAANGFSEKAASVSSGPFDIHNFYGSSSSDSLRDFRTFGQDIIDCVLEANRDSNNNNVVHKHSQNGNNKTSNTSSSPSYPLERNARSISKQPPLASHDATLSVGDKGPGGGGRGRQRETRADRRKVQSHVMRQRHDVSYDRQQQGRLPSDNAGATVTAATTSSLPAPLNHPHTQAAGHRRTSRLPAPTSGEPPTAEAPPLTSQHALEMEARVREGQPTQLHFFLPQLADSVSEGGSGGNLSGRCNYRERRLELLDWQDPRSGSGSRSGADGGLHHDSSAVGPGGGIYDEDDNDPTSTTTITELPNPSQHRLGNAKDINSLPRHRGQHYPNSDPHHHHHPHHQAAKPHGHHRGAGSKERVTACDLRNGHLALNRGRQSPQPRDDGGNLTQKQQKRQISPLRAAAPQKPERPARSRRAANSPFRAPVYLESQLPSEKLKKQIEDFPTLVSMEFSDTDASLQVR